MIRDWKVIQEVLEEVEGIEHQGQTIVFEDAVFVKKRTAAYVKEGAVSVDSLPPGATTVTPEDERKTKKCYHARLLLKDGALMPSPIPSTDGVEAVGLTLRGHAMLDNLRNPDGAQKPTAQKPTGFLAITKEKRGDSSGS